MESNEFITMTKREMIELMMNGKVLESHSQTRCYFDENHLDDPFVCQNVNGEVSLMIGYWSHNPWCIYDKKRDWENKSLVLCWEENDDDAYIALRVWNKEHQASYSFSGKAIGTKYYNYELYTGEITPRMQEMIDKCE